MGWWQKELLDVTKTDKTKEKLWSEWTHLQFECSGEVIYLTFRFNRLREESVFLGEYRNSAHTQRFLIAKCICIATVQAFSTCLKGVLRITMQRLKQFRKSRTTCTQPVEDGWRMHLSLLARMPNFHVWLPISVERLRQFLADRSQGRGLRTLTNLVRGKFSSHHVTGFVCHEFWEIRCVVLFACDRMWRQKSCKVKIKYSMHSILPATSNGDTKVRARNNLLTIWITSRIQILRRFSIEECGVSRLQLQK